jgi:hypothetical protein
MSKDLELARVNLQIQAEHVARLLGMAAAMARKGGDPKAIEEKLELVETLLWKHHRRLARLKAEAEGRLLQVA